MLFDQVQFKNAVKRTESLTVTTYHDCKKASISSVEKRNSYQLTRYFVSVHFFLTLFCTSTTFLLFLKIFHLDTFFHSVTLKLINQENPMFSLYKTYFSPKISLHFKQNLSLNTKNSFEYLISKSHLICFLDNNTFQNFRV